MLEVGKYYINRLGEKVGPVSGDSLFGLERDSHRWYPNGYCLMGRECEDDLISPYYEWRYCIVDKVGIWALGLETDGKIHTFNTILVDQHYLNSVGSPHKRWICWLGDFKIAQPDREPVWPNDHNKPCKIKKGENWVDARLVGKDEDDYLVTQAYCIIRVKKENIRCV
jgi:hypothetical protein